MNEEIKYKIFNDLNKYSWDYIYNEKLLLIIKNLYNSEDYYEIIGYCLIKWKKIRLDIWNDIKDDWINFQYKLTAGRICPICGCHYSNHFPLHLKSHNLTLDDYVLKLNNLNEFPKCANINCNNKIIRNGYGLNTYCSYSCEHYHHSYLGTNPLQHNNLKFDSEGKSISHKKIVHDQLANNKHPWSSNNLVRDEFNKSITHINGFLTKLRNGTTYSWKCCIKIKFILNNRLLCTKSYWEFVTLCYLVFINNIDPKDIEYEKEQENSFKRIDFYINSLNKYYEPHLDESISEKIDEYSKEFPSYDIVYLTSNDINKMEKELYNLNSDKINYKFIKNNFYILYKPTFCYDFDTFKMTI